MQSGPFGGLDVPFYLSRMGLDVPFTVKYTVMDNIQSEV